MKFAPLALGVLIGLVSWISAEILPSWDTDPDVIADCLKEGQACAAGIKSLKGADFETVCKELDKGFKCLVRVAEDCGELMPFEGAKYRQMKELLTMCGLSVDEDDEEDEDEVDDDDDDDDDGDDDGGEEALSEFEKLEMCMKTSQSYIMDCVEETGFEMLSSAVLYEVEGLSIKCSDIRRMAHCMVTRTAEECGAEGAKTLSEVLEDKMPEAMKEDCELAEDVDEINVDVVLAEEEDEPEEREDDDDEPEDQEGEDDEDENAEEGSASFLK